MPELSEYTKSKGYDVAVIYHESESGWKSSSQAALQRLLDDCRNGKHLDLLLIWDLSRLSRQGIARILNLIEFFKAYGVMVISLKEIWAETEGPMQGLLYAVFGWAAQYESQIKIERTLAGLVRASDWVDHRGVRIPREDSAVDTCYAILVGGQITGVNKTKLIGVRILSANSNTKLRDNFR